jgi:hypothetical protein
MQRKHEILLTIDGIINLIIGILLLMFPLGMAQILGIPESNLDFYPTILGGVIFGIGIALMIERYGYKKNIHGLGLGGAIVINFCGALVLLIWLLMYPLDIPPRGFIILWLIALTVLIVGIIEALAKSWIYE